MSTLQTPWRVVRGAQNAEDSATLLDELRVAGFRGPRYRAFIEDLWLYGWNVLRGLLRDGKIATIKTGTPHTTLSADELLLLHQSTEQRDQLALDTLLKAVPAFEEHVRAGRWHAEAGASLPTYFIGTCARQFWDEHARWRRQRAQQIYHPSLYGLLAPEAPQAPGTVERREALRLILAGADREQKLICGGLLQGKTQAEIASELGITERSVEYRLRRLRQRALVLIERGRLDADWNPRSARRRGPTAARRARRTPVTAR